MTTITLSIPPEAKRYIKMKAASQDMTMRDFVLRSVGWQNKKQIEHEDGIGNLNKEVPEETSEMESWTAKWLMKGVTPETVHGEVVLGTVGKEIW